MRRAVGRDKLMNKTKLAVSAKKVEMQFGSFRAVKNVSFELETGRFLTILGPSGSGKTTLLRMIAGFLTPTEGEIFINAQSEWCSRGSRCFPI